MSRLLPSQRKLPCQGKLSLPHTCKIIFMVARINGAGGGHSFSKARVKRHREWSPNEVQGRFESRGGTSWAPVPNKPTVSVDVKQHFNDNTVFRAQELCESRGGRPGLPSLITLRFLWT